MMYFFLSNCTLSPTWMTLILPNMSQWCVNMLRDLWLDFTTPAQTAVKGRTNSWPPFLDKKRKPFIGHSQASQAAVSCTIRNKSIQNHSIRKYFLLFWVYLKIRRPQIDPRKDPFNRFNQCEFWGAPWSCLIVIVASDSVYLSTQYILFHIITWPVFQIPNMISTSFLFSVSSKHFNAKSKHAYHCQVISMSKYGQVLLGVLDSIYFCFVVCGVLLFSNLKHTQKIVTLCNVRRFNKPVMTSPADPSYKEWSRMAMPIFTRQHHGRWAPKTYFHVFPPSTPNVQSILKGQILELVTCPRKKPSGSRSCVLLLLHKNFTVWINLKGKKNGHDWWIWSLKSWDSHWAQKKISWLFIGLGKPCYLTQKVPGFRDQYQSLWEWCEAEQQHKLQWKIMTSQSVRSTNSIKKHLTTS